MNLETVAIILLALGGFLVHANEFELLKACNSLDDPNCVVEAQGLYQPTPQFLAGTQDNLHVSADPPIIEFCDSGLKFSINKRFDNPSILSTFDVLFGKAEVELKASHGSGIISSFYLQSKNLDEIDVAETFGSNPYEFQTNFFIKGNTSTHDRGDYHKMDVPPMVEFHKYGIEWTEDKIVWLLDGKVIRVVSDDHPQGFPHAPMYIKFSLWAGGDELNEKGTIEWSGGRTNYDELPYSMYIKSLRVVDYSTGFQHTYGDSMDDWITLNGGHVNNYDSDNKFEITENVFRDFDTGAHIRNERGATDERSAKESSTQSVIKPKANSIGNGVEEFDKKFTHVDQNNTTSFAAISNGITWRKPWLLLLDTLAVELLVIFLVF